MAECYLILNGEKYEVEDMDISMKQWPTEDRPARYTVEVDDETLDERMGGR